MYNCTYFMTFAVWEIHLLHQLRITDRHFYAINFSFHAMSADLFDIRYTITIDWLAICFLQTLTDRMWGRTLCQCCVLQKLLFRNCIVMYSADLKYALCHRTGLIKYYIFGLRHGLKIIGTFDQYTFMTCSSNPGKEAERNTDNQCTRTTDNQKCQCPVDPVTPFRC